MQYFLALLSIFANAGILEHKGSPNGTNLELTQDHVLQARMLWIFNRRDRCCKKSVLCLFCPFSFFCLFLYFSPFSSFCIEVEKCRCRFRKCTILYKNLTSHVSVCTDPAHLFKRPNKEIMGKKLERNCKRFVKGNSSGVTFLHIICQLWEEKWVLHL